MLRFHRKLSTKAHNSLVTKLSNGVTVASSPSPGHFVSCGVLVNAGSAKETEETRGSAHFLDRMAFKSTASMPANTLIQAIESIGGNMLAHSSREAIMYQSSVFPKHLGDAISILASVVKEPLFLPEELNDVKTQIAYETDAMQWNYPQLLPEKLHQLAFGNKLNDRYAIQTVKHTNDIATLCTPTCTIGTPLFCDDAKSLAALSPKTLKQFHQTWYTPDRIVVAGVGMPHQQLVELAEKHFGSLKPATPEIQAAQKKVLEIPVKYKGGIALVDTNGQPVSPNPDDRLLTHVYIGFEAPGMLDPDVYAMATLASLMGGGGSFSAGGPGKGMYTRLYTEVLNRYHWVENCNMLSYSYQPTSLFGISASVPPHPETHAHILPILLSHLHQTTSPTSLSAVPLSRAKNQLKSNLLMSLESRSVELEDISRQVTAQDGERVSVSEMCKRVDSVTPEDIARVAQRLFKGLDCESPLRFGDGKEGGVMQNWTRTGDGGPTVLVHGPLSSPKDAMYALDERVREWGLGGDLFLRSGMKGKVDGYGLGGGKGRGLGSRLFGRSFGN